MLWSQEVDVLLKYRGGDKLSDKFIFKAVRRWQNKLIRPTMFNCDLGYELVIILLNSNQNKLKKLDWRIKIEKNN